MNHMNSIILEGVIIQAPQEKLDSTFTFRIESIRSKLVANMREIKKTTMVISLDLLTYTKYRTGLTLGRTIRTIGTVAQIGAHNPPYAPRIQIDAIDIDIYPIKKTESEDTE